MDKQTAIGLIKDFHERPFPHLIKRVLEAKVPATKKAITIIGPRRAGKTYFLFDIMTRFEGVDHTEMLYVNLEDDRLLPIGLKDMDMLLKTYYEIYPQNKEKTLHLFLDEVQNVRGWELFVRRVLDTENIQVYLTGSSSSLLAKEIATSMRGRSIVYTILPFSFKEYLSAKGVKLKKYLSSKETAWIMKYLNEYVNGGGFPEVTLETDEYLRLKTLSDYVDTMLLRDVIDRYKVKNTKVLRMLYSGIISSFSRDFSIHKFKRFISSQGIKVSKNTLYEYAHHLSDAFAYIPIKKYSTSMRETEQSIPKVYLIDNGYAIQTGIKLSENMGRLFENTVAVELFRRNAANPMMVFYYWKGNNEQEVDFVIKEGAEVMELIQVCYNPDEPETKQRETRALVRAGEELKCKHLTVITWSREGDEKLSGVKISYIPLWKWLIGK